MHLCVCRYASHVSVNSNVEQKNSRLALKLLLVVLGMTGFGFALIPLYDVLCELTGINGKVGTRVDSSTLNYVVDKERNLGLDLVTSLGKATPLIVETETKSLQIHPGQFYVVNYRVHNQADKALTIRAVPSVAPGVAAADFKIIECFCFEPLRLEAGEAKNLPLRFVVNPGIAQQSNHLALAITFLNTNKD